MNLDEITMVELQDGLKKTQTVIVPFGTVEEHGTHLPLGTDTYHALEVARMASKETAVFVAPPVHYGVCTSTYDHPGTFSITADALRLLVGNLILSFHSKGFRNIILFSGHAGGLHMSALKEVGEEAVKDLPELNLAVLSVYDLLEKGYGEIIETANDSHAGEGETSGMLFLRPELVKGRAPEEYPQRISYFITRDKLKYWPGGVWGDPGKASPEKGKKLLGMAVKEMVRIIREISEFEG
ncbi:MAG: creatininase family protein [Nitrospinae bacterium]|nr:creatininase family protein [Nitrospinota bacterium]